LGDHIWDIFECVFFPGDKGSRWEGDALEVFDMAVVYPLV
jgi:hypothetical protein